MPLLCLVYGCVIGHWLDFFLLGAFVPSRVMGWVSQGRLKGLRAGELSA